ncbi:putative uncharacterized protein [Candidatus Colimorpha enterica]|uniref:1,3-beta-galactosyl-N-acetylhexosamine phosphorylase n=1 Tax=Candidatus Colimorpha enterica TaxID=3083063 RepID=R6TI45_9BACT|nr:putative uncharacterized protein [Candidatus Colimorpha enterica]
MKAEQLQEKIEDLLPNPNEGYIKNGGRVTIPTDNNYFVETKRIAEKWGADAVRNCDGTHLPANASELAEKVYGTYFVVRGDNEWADSHPEELQNVLLMSERKTARDENLQIDLLEGYFDEQLKVNPTDYRKYWQVFDRTTGQEHANWSYDGNRMVTINDPIAFHEYTVNFFAYNMWDSTQMYNYLTNDWNTEKHKVFDPRYEQTHAHIESNLRSWLKRNDQVNVVRFTTFLYHFFLVFGDNKKEKHVDWFGYPMSASPKAFEDFRNQYGYELKSEDIVDGGYYHNHFRLPTKAFSDYMEYTQKYVAKTISQLVDIVHQEGKEAMMFLGDSWIGAEPYGKHFADIHLDSVVGSVGGGVTVRMLSEIPHVKYREGRMLPYFFTDTFFDGNEENALAELNKNWRNARRALMRKPLDRIGYGGYLSLAAKFPTFIDRVGEICEEFRTIYQTVDNKKPYCHVRVGILNAWGKLRRWMSHMVAHELWYQQIYSYQGLLESLSGLPVDVSFLSFDDVKNGVPSDIDVLINVGAAYTAFSGGEAWRDEKLVSAVRRFVHEGGGFVGIGEPSACEHGGHYFQLADVMGVDQERGLSISEDKYNIIRVDHEITEDAFPMDYGEDVKNIYALKGARVLDIVFSDRVTRDVNVGEVKMATNEYGDGRSFYVTGLPYSLKNARVLYKALCWVAKKDLRICYCTNKTVDCHYYPSGGKYAIVNHSTDEQQTEFYDIDGFCRSVSLAPLEIKYIKNE